ncbi:MAG: hypothetical protein IJ821_04715 [Lachnospiraceae bacterium]|nr:hypothetical protein [Lachnospiraceae bacterium]
MGSATSRTTSSDKGENIGVMTIGNIGYIAKYADSSTEEDPIIKVGDYEVRVNDVDPHNATKVEMFALMSYMDDKGLIENTGMKSFGKMTAYGAQAEYNGFCSDLSDPELAWTKNRDWTAILQNAKETFFGIPQAYNQGLNCESIVAGLERWAETRCNSGESIITEVSGESEVSSDMDATCIPIIRKGYGDTAAYTRCITANIKTKEAYAQHDSSGEVIYSYRETEQSFNIIINSDGKDKTYTITGIDENGEEFERAFDPYNLDPKDMDYPEFAAMCMYIRQTDETADLIASSYFTDTSYFDGIFDRGDRVGLLGQYAEEYGDSEPSLADLANKIFDAINTFFDRIMTGSGFSDDAFPLLFADLDDIETQEKISALKNGYTYFDNTTDPVSETIVSKHNQYTDPDTGEIVPVNVKYITAYTEQGISCKEISDVGGKISQRDLWSLLYDSPDSYEKVQEFLKSFSKDQNLTFAPQEKFWKDFMKDDFDIDGFRAYYDSTDNGRINVEKALQEGKKLGDVLTEPYAEYINNTHFIGKVFTEQEMWDNWNAQIEANQRALGITSTGDKTSTDSGDRVRAMREQAFLNIGKNASETVQKAWLDAADEIGMDGQGFSATGTLDHIPQFMIQRFIRQYNGYDPDDVLGGSISSALQAAQDAIYSLEHPLEPGMTRSSKVIAAREKERTFYERFIEKLMGMSA